MKLGPIKQISVERLKINEKNKQYFKTEDAAYFRALSEDIKKRGIQDALIAKRDGILLAGHNRLLVAKTLGIKTVPVRQVDKITEREEIEYIIKDNLLRRHLSFQEREALYLALVPGFKERILVPGKSPIGVKAADLAEQTGLNPKTINYDLSRLRSRAKKEINGKAAIVYFNEKAVEMYGKAVSRMLNTAIVEGGETAKELRRITESALKRLNGIQR